MQYIVYDLKEQQKGSLVEIKINMPANIHLIDKVNLDYMKHHREYKDYGGLAMSTPFRVTIPEDRHWYILIDMVTNLKYSVTVYPPWVAKNF